MQTLGTPLLKTNGLALCEPANCESWVSTTEEIIDSGMSSEKRSQVQQDINVYGNLTARRQYGFYNSGGSPVLLKTFTYT